VLSGFRCAITGFRFIEKTEQQLVHFPVIFGTQRLRRIDEAQAGRLATGLLLPGRFCCCFSRYSGRDPARVPAVAFSLKAKAENRFAAESARKRPVQR